MPRISHTPDKAARNATHMDHNKGCNYSSMNSFVPFLLYDDANPVYPVESRCWTDCDRLLYKDLKFLYLSLASSYFGTTLSSCSISTMLTCLVVIMKVVLSSSPTEVTYQY